MRYLVCTIWDFYKKENFAKKNQNFYIYTFLLRTIKTSIFDIFNTLYTKI